MARNAVRNTSGGVCATVATTRATLLLTLVAVINDVASSARLDRVENTVIETQRQNRFEESTHTTLLRRKSDAVHEIVKKCDRFEKLKAAYYARDRNPGKKDSKLSQMAALAEGVYFWGSQLAGWTLVKHWDTLNRSDCLYTANVGIYKKITKGKPECALVFAGSDDINAWKDNFNMLPTMTSWCGLSGVHQGFISRLNLFLEGERYPEFKSLLQSGECGGGATIVGHSLGGALASAAAACISHRGEYTVDGLYTFGSPGISVTQQVGTQDGGCFKGARVYARVSGMQDPFPATLWHLGYQHPKLQTVIFEDGTPTVHRCVSGTAARSPSISPFFNKNLHAMEGYAGRALATENMVDLLNHFANDTAAILKVESLTLDKTVAAAAGTAVHELDAAAGAPCMLPMHFCDFLSESFKHVWEEVVKSLPGLPPGLPWSPTASSSSIEAPH